MARIPPPRSPERKDAAAAGEVAARGELKPRRGADALGIYLVVPFCRAKCSYCNFASGVFSPALYSEYVRLLTREMDLAVAELDASGAEDGTPAVDSIYCGGGTPTLLSAPDLAALAAATRERFAVAADAEFTVEAAPGTLDEGIVASLAAAGANRVSLGAQSFVAAEARAVGRRHTAAEVFADLARLRAAGIANLSVDLIAGLPGQTEASWRESLRAAVAAAVPHVSVYLLEMDEDSRLGRESLAGGTRYHAGELPDEDFAAAAYEMAREALAAAGLEQYEISNFARPGFASRHNLRYWLRRPYLGFGLAAHSLLPAAGGRGERRRGNTESLEDYMSALRAGTPPPRETESVDDLARRQETMFLGLRRNAGVDLGAFARDFGADAFPWEREVAELRGLGLLERAGEVIRLTPRGRLLSNEVFARFV